MPMAKTERPSRFLRSAIAGQGFFLGQVAWHWRPQWLRSRAYASEASSQPQTVKPEPAQPMHEESRLSKAITDPPHSSMPDGWEDNPNYNISSFSQLPHRHFGYNQHMLINAEFKEALRGILWQFRAPIRYAFAYGSGVFAQTNTSASSKPSPHPHPPEAVTKWQAGGEKTIDFIFGVSYTQHWHSINLQQHRPHYSFLGSFGSNIVSKVQDSFGAGVYFNPYVTVNGISIKYGVVNLDTVYRDLSEWDTLYIAGRLQKPVKILRDDARIRLANQVNLISALRTALLMLPTSFTERELYTKIAGISYMGDPRMTLGAENPSKVSNIVDSQMTNFRTLYLPLIENLPNVSFNDSKTSTRNWIDATDINCRLEQDSDPVKRGNMVRRLPKSFRKKLYNVYREAFNMSAVDFAALVAGGEDDNSFSKMTGSNFDERIAGDKDLAKVVGEVVKDTVQWPTITQSAKGILTAGPARSWQYFGEKRARRKELRRVGEEKDKIGNVVATTDKTDMEEKQKG